MAKHKPSEWVVLLVLGISAVILLTTLRSHSQNILPQVQEQGEQAKRVGKVEPSRFPVVDYVVSESANSKDNSKQEAKGKKYNRRETAVDPHLISVSDRYDWDSSISSLPVTQSDAVVIAELESAEAHLSSDKSGVYSEFTFRICQILKNDVHNPLPFPGSVVAERAGGRIRFPSGQVTLVYVSNLGMPRVGAKYVLFLTHNFPYQVRRDEDYRILTGYELLGSDVIPLDASGVVNFDAHRNQDEQTFLASLQVALKR